MLDIYYFSSKTGTTKRFIDKIRRIDGNVRAFNLAETTDVVADRPYVVVCPCYCGAHSNKRANTPPAVRRFLKKDGHSDLLRGVVGAGNRNFGSYFAVAGDEISERFDVPLICKIELAGSQEEAKNVYDFIKEGEVNE